MADYLLLAVRYLHILFAITWIGSIAYSVFVLRSVIGRIGMPARKEMMQRLIPVVIHFVPMSAVMTIGFGALLYLVMGRFDAGVLLGTPWGQILFVALILALALFAFGVVVVVGGSRKTLRHLEEPGCTHAEEMGKLARTLNRGQVIALAWGFVVLALMVSASQGF